MEFLKSMRGSKCLMFGEIEKLLRKLVNIWRSERLWRINLESFNLDGKSVRVFLIFETGDDLDLDKNNCIRYFVFRYIWYIVVESHYVGEIMLFFGGTLSVEMYSVWRDRCDFYVTLLRQWNTTMIGFVKIRFTWWNILITTLRNHWKHNFHSIDSLIRHFTRSFNNSRTNL